MTSKLSILAIASALLLASCSKQMSDVSPNRTLTANQSAKAEIQSTASDRGWYGFYAGSDVGNSDTLFAADIVKNGVIKLPFYSNANQVFSIFRYDIPAEHVISGDSLIYELKIKNPKDNSHYDWDVYVDIKGTEHDGYVQFVADNDYIQYNRAFVGAAEVSSQPVLVHDFETFAILRIALKNDKATIRMNGVLLGTINYGAENRIGRVKTIEFGGKGYPSCTFVKLFNSISGNPILTSTFNTDGVGTPVYY